MEQLPNDPVMLLSVINTKLRDFYPTLDDLCQDLNIPKDTLVDKLRMIDYNYEREQNQFV